MDKLPPEQILDIIKEMDLPTIKEFCKTNKYIRSICKKNKDYILKNILKTKYNINSLEPLYYLLSKDRIIEILKDRNPDYNLLKSLFNYKTTDGITLLMYALMNRFKNINKLLDMGIPIQGITYRGTTPLMYALENSTDNIINNLIYMGASVQGQDLKTGLTPLLIAIKTRRPDQIIHNLLDHGASVRGKAKTEKGGLTPLISALALKRNPVIINRLLDMGASVHITMNNITPLSLAMTTSTPEIVERIRKIMENASEDAESDNDSDEDAESENDDIESDNDSDEDAESENDDTESELEDDDAESENDNEDDDED